MQPVTELMETVDMETDLPPRASDAGPEDAPMDWADHVFAAIDSMHLALNDDGVRETDGHLKAARE